MISSTTRRVPEHTPAELNERIKHRTEENVAYCAAAGPDSIEIRLRELDREWDIERVLEANAATMSLIGLTLGASRDRKWYLLSAAVAGFLLQHAIQGWCPPVPLFRRLGVRTAAEIDHERYALKALRGDFRYIPSQMDTGIANVDEVMEAVRH